MNRPPLEQKLALAWPTDRWRDVGVLVAVSGGPDSVALLRSLVALAEPGSGFLRIAHFNHRWRGRESDEDQQFVVELSRSLGLECQVGTAEGGEDLAPDGLEAAAREARYRFLLDTAERLGARYLVTGHTADDQAETILHHILRGTGLLGLAGMRHARRLSQMVTLVRPLLEVRRSEVLDYLAAIDQSYRSDVTNADRAMTRNRIREELLPLLCRDYSPTVVVSLLRLGALAADAQSVIEPLAEVLLEQATLEQSAERLVLACDRLAEQPRHLVRELFLLAWRRNNWPRQAMGLAEWDQLADLAQAPAGANVTVKLPGDTTVLREGTQLTVSRRAILSTKRTTHA